MPEVNQSKPNELAKAIAEVAGKLGLHTCGYSHSEIAGEFQPYLDTLTTQHAAEVEALREELRRAKAVCKSKNNSITDLEQQLTDAKRVAECGEGEKLSNCIACLRTKIADQARKLVRAEAEAKDARNVILLYRRYEHAIDAECQTGDECDTDEMLTEASFAGQDFMEKYPAKGEASK